MVASALYAVMATTLAAAAVALVAAARLSWVATVVTGASDDAIVSVQAGVPTRICHFNWDTSGAIFSC